MIGCEKEKHRVARPARFPVGSLTSFTSFQLTCRKTCQKQGIQRILLVTKQKLPNIFDFFFLKPPYCIQCNSNASVWVLRNHATCSNGVVDK